VADLALATMAVESSSSDLRNFDHVQDSTKFYFINDFLVLKIIQVSYHELIKMLSGHLGVVEKRLLLKTVIAIHIFLATISNAR
jgi:hypothetical protein